MKNEMFIPQLKSQYKLISHIRTTAFLLPGNGSHWSEYDGFGKVC